MASAKRKSRAKLGRPSIGPYELLQFNMTAEMRAAITRWRAKSAEVREGKIPTEAAAVRELIEIGLAAPIRPAKAA